MLIMQIEFCNTEISKILFTKISAALSYYRVPGLYFLLDIFATTIETDIGYYSLKA